MKSMLKITDVSRSKKVSNPRFPCFLPRKWQRPAARLPRISLPYVFAVLLPGVRHSFSNSVVGIIDLIESSSFVISGFAGAFSRRFCSPQLV
jgi:hypothetical protein